MFGLLQSQGSQLWGILAESCWRLSPKLFQPVGKSAKEFLIVIPGNAVRLNHPAIHATVQQRPLAIVFNP